MTLRQIQYIQSVLEYGSISKAAEQLYVAQSSISAAIRQVEEEYRITLFERTSRGVVPTARGTEFLQDIRYVTDFYQAVEEKYKSPEPQSESFCVAAHHHTEGLDAYRRLIMQSGGRLFRTGYFEGGTEHVMASIESGLCELGVLYFTRTSSNVMMKECNKRDLTFHHIRYAPMCACVHRSHPLASFSSVKLEQLADYPFLSYDQLDPASRKFTSAVQQWQRSRRVILISDRAMAYTLAKGGEGYFTGSGRLSEEEKAMGLVAVPVSDLEEIEVGWMQKTYRPLSGPGSLFLELLLRSPDPGEADV